jgi:hypothetical protein
MKFTVFRRSLQEIFISVICCTTAAVAQPLPAGTAATRITAAADFPVKVFQPDQDLNPVVVPLYEKLEYGLDLPPDVDALVAAYFLNRKAPEGINPFDPEDINIVATFTSPTGKSNRVIYGFYYEPFTSSAMSWTADTANDYDFRVRFAPVDTGAWACSISVNSPKHKFSSTYTVSSLQFTCVPHPVPGEEQGYLQVGQYKRQLKYSYSGASFFAIGQNIPWVHHPYYNANDFIPSEFEALNRNVENLADNGGNMVRLILAPYSHQVEWERLGDYSDYISTSGRKQTRQHNAWELDKFFELCHRRNVYVNLDLDLHDTHTNNGEETLYQWQSNPYKVRLGLGDPIDFLTNADAVMYFKRKLRYIIARWGYETSLGIIELMSEQDNWGDYNSNPALRYALLAWHEDMANYIRTGLGEPNHLLSTSFMERQDPELNAFRLPLMDVTSDHKYAGARKMNKERFDIMNGNTIASSVNGMLVDYDKPSILGEQGLAGTGADANAIEGCSDVSFHNSLWATAFADSYGAGLNWWQSDNDLYRENFRPLHEFFNVTDVKTGLNRIFETHKWIPGYWKERRVLPDDYRVEVFSMHTVDGALAWGWAHNATFYWANLLAGCPEKDKAARAVPPDDDHQTSSTVYESEKIRIEGLSLVSDYTLEWYTTRGHATLVSTVTQRSNIFGHFKTVMPAGADYAFKMYKQEGPGFRSNESTAGVMKADTLFCGQDTIHVSGLYRNDMAGEYHYAWDFGNGQVSHSPHPAIVYTHPGTYDVSLVVTGNGRSDTLKQQIVVLNDDYEEGDSQKMRVAGAH